MIREATHVDLPRIVEMGRTFRRDSTYVNYLIDNPERMAELATQLIDKNGLLVSESEGIIVGMLGYIVYSHFISGELVAGEVFWWVEPNYRGHGLRLLHEMEARAKKAGAKHIQMIAPNQRVASLYERLKYEFVESTYQRLV